MGGRRGGDDACPPLPQPLARHAKGRRDFVRGFLRLYLHPDRGTLLDDKGERYIAWPANDFYAYVPDDDAPGLLLFSGVEPNLKWKTYCDTVIALADRYGVELMVTLGSLFSTVPHTRPFPVSSVVSSREKLGKRVLAIGAFDSPYQGPTAIHTVLADLCRQRGLDHVSLWGHGPHYLPSMPNPKLSYNAAGQSSATARYSIGLGGTATGRRPV